MTTEIQQDIAGLAEAGAAMVSGSAIFKSADRAGTIAAMKAACG